MDDKINKIILQIKENGWARPMNLDAIVNHWTVAYQLQAQNNNWYNTQSIVTRVIYKPSNFSSTIKQNYHKEAFDKLRKYINGQLHKRSGLRGYRGYFNFKDIRVFEKYKEV